MEKEIKLDEEDCRVFQSFVEEMNSRLGGIYVKEFEVNLEKRKKKYEIEFEVL